MVKKLNKVAKALGKASKLHIKEMKSGGSKKGNGKKT